MGGMTGLLLLLWAGVTVGSVVDLQKRIIGGRNCLKNERGYHVFLKMKDGPKNYLCSGSLIDNEWILTAGHCWETGWTIKAVFRNSKEVTISNGNIFKHKDHDIMLLKITNPTHQVTAGRLPFDCVNKPKKLDKVQIAGYYSTAQPGDKKNDKLVDTTKPLQCARTTVDECHWSDKCLQKILPRWFSTLICFQDNKVDISDGDSGGGLVFNDRIYGVNVMSENYACAGRAKAIDVCEYMDWIVTTTGIPRPTQ